MASLAQRPATARLVSGAALGTTNLTALGVVVSLAMFSGQLFLLFAGLWLYALLVVRDVVDPRFWRRIHAADAEAQRRLPQSSELADEELRATVAALRAAYAELQRVLARTPEAIRGHVRAAVSSVEEMRAHAAQLVRDADELHRCGRAIPRTAVERDIKRLREQLDHASGEAKTDYERAVRVREEQLATADRLKRERDRIFAALQLIVVTVESLPSRIYRLRLLEARARQDLVGELNEHLLRINGEIGASQRLLEGLADEPAEWQGASP